MSSHAAPCVELCSGVDVEHNWLQRLHETFGALGGPDRVYAFVASEDADEISQA